MRRHHTRRRAFSLAAIGTTAILAISAVSAGAAGPPVPRHALKYLSIPHTIRAWTDDPSSAPLGVQPAMERAAAARADRLGSTNGSTDTASVATPEAESFGTAAHTPRVFNRDTDGAPQIEESIGVCASDPRYVLGGTIDLRAVLYGSRNLSGWHFSSNGGASVTREGTLPGMIVGTGPASSAGDPVIGVGSDCDLYYATLVAGQSLSIAVYKSTPGTLASCPGGEDKTCWPTRKLVSPASGAVLADKPWMAVGRSGGKDVVWVTYTAFADFGGPFEEPEGGVMAVRCNDALTSCTRPIPLTSGEALVQDSDVEIGPDGSTYAIWTEVEAEFPSRIQQFRYKMRVAPPGSTTFGPERLIYHDRRPIPFGGRLHANDFRINSAPKLALDSVNGATRAYVVWESCLHRLLEQICEGPQIYLRMTDTAGRTWSGVKQISVRGDNYFPTIDADPNGTGLAVAYYTHRHDPAFHSRQDVEVVRLDQDGDVVKRVRATTRSGDTQADPLIGGIFIGDYIEVAMVNGKAYVHYNSTHRKIRILEQGYEEPQQDNYLAIVDL